MIGKDALVPYLRIFPIWKYGPRWDFDGRRIGDGWYPERYGQWRSPTQEAPPTTRAESA